MKKSFKNYNLVAVADDKLQKVPFIFPGVGDTGEFLMIRSQHSSVYRDASLKAERQVGSLIAAAGSLDAVDKDLMKDIQDRSFATLVESWSFEEECSIDNVVEFFHANPQTYDTVNTTAAKDTLFFVKQENV